MNGTRSEAHGPTACPRWLKVAISLFIVFHFTCVIAWLLPSSWPLKAAFYGLKLPFPSRRSGPDPNGGSGDPDRRDLVTTYIHNTAQYQEWAMFAPNPLQINRYVGAHVVFQRGTWKEYTFPRLSEMNVLEAWIEKRYRKYQQRLADLKEPAYDEDAARWIARQMNEPGNPPVRVTLFLYESPIPRHDRPGLRGAGWIDYSELLRKKAKYSPTLLVDYVVKPGDLP